jgi:hypothetical protein
MRGRAVVAARADRFTLRLRVEWPSSNRCRPALDLQTGLVSARNYRARAQSERVSCRPSVSDDVATFRC